VRALLDTHVLLWWWTDSPRLSGAAREVIADPGNEIFISTASVWEIRTKQRLGKLSQIPDLSVHFGDLLQRSRFTVLDIGWRHALVAGAYPAEHRDPFDRMLAAQALTERLTLLTADPALSQFDIARLW
jgi:PIN domain nuclease of toxin-antitoxin system